MRQVASAVDLTLALRCLMRVNSAVQKRDEADSVVPFLKWAGGKRWLFSACPELFPKSLRRYIEPFLGGGAVFFGLAPTQSILADVNVALISTYAAIKANPAEVLRHLTKHARLHNDDYYYRVRAKTASDAFERAAQFIYLNRTCWNGLYRVNRRGKFNVPRGTKNSVLLSTDNFPAVQRRLENAALLPTDFAETISLAARGDFVFVDPPYATHSASDTFLKYNDKLFSWDDQQRLFESVVAAKGRGARVLISNIDHSAVRRLYKGFGALRRVTRLDVLAGNGGKRGPTSELVIASWL